MRQNKLIVFFTSAIVILLFNVQINATGGYFRHGYGVKYSAMAGSGVALSLSSIGFATNPASLAFLGTRYDINAAYFSPIRSYEVIGTPSGFPGTFGLVPGTVESGSKGFPIPSIAANWQLGNYSFGLGVVANGGMNTDYPTATFYDPTSPGTGVNLEQAIIGVTFAIKLNKNNAFGITGLYGYQRFAAKGLLSFAGFSSDPAALTGNRHSISTGFGVRFGYMGKLSKYISIGASYQTKMSMGKFDEYKGLFAEKGGFDIPANWVAGISVNASNNLTLNFDVQQILYSGVKSISNPMNLKTNSPMTPTGAPNPNFKPLGNAAGWGFGWQDIFVYKFGGMYKINKDWTLMFGYSYGQQPIPNSEVLFNILAPGVEQQHITFGFTKKIGRSNEFSMAIMYAPNTSVTGPNPLEAPGQQNIKIEMKQFQVEFGYAFH